MSVDDRDARLARLERENEALRRTTRALMARVERATDSRGSAHSLFEHAASLQHAVTLRTQELEAKRAELAEALAALQATNERLREESVRSAQLAESAEAGSRAKSAFLANMSHEIRTPLIGVIGMATLLLDTPLSSEQRRYAALARQSGEGLLAIIDDVLDFSKIEAGRLELQPVEFGLADLLDDVTGALALRAHQKGLELVCSSSVEVPPRLVGDALRLRQVLINLAGNAVKFTSHGEVAVHASVEARVGREVRLRITVRDTGIGIPADKLDAVFDEFTQADSSTTRAFGGTGLGLAISRQLVELMGGTIAVRSTLGEGTEFTVTVRVEKAPGSHAASYPASLPGVRALVVDDNPTTLEALRALMAGWGMRPRVATSAGEALRTLRAMHDAGEPPQLALLDLQMPDVDGLTLAETIRTSPRFRDVALVRLTPLGWRGDATRLATAAFCTSLEKPVRTRDLLEALPRALERTAYDSGDARCAQGGSQRALTLAPAAPRAFSARVLVTEDNPVNQLVAVGLLARLGIDADCAASGAEALDALERATYDLVLMDVQMPDMDGLTATGLIRDPATPVRDHAVPIVAMTAHALPGDRQRCLDAGMTDYVPKPLSLDALAAALERCLPAAAGAARAPGREVAEPSLAAPAVVVAPSAVDDRARFDPAALLARLDRDPRLAASVLAGALDELPRQVAALRAAVDAGDTRRALFAAHALKGVAGDASGRRLHAHAGEVERIARTGTLDGVPARLPPLEDELAAFLAVARRWEFAPAQRTANVGG